MNTLLLLSLFFCHFLADYTHLSTNYMLDAKRLGKPFLPILAHACVHGILMFFPLVITLGFTWFVPILVWFQIITHFFIDVLKGRMNGWFPSLQSPANKWHWVVFGADQFLHAIVIIIMADFCNFIQNLI